MYPGLPTGGWKSFTARFGEMKLTNFSKNMSKIFHHL